MVEVSFLIVPSRKDKILLSRDELGRTFWEEGSRGAGLGGCTVLPTWGLGAFQEQGF